MSGLTRDDEERFKALKKKADIGALTEEDAMVLSYLEDRYAKFLEEGIRKLREGSPHGNSPSGSFSKFLPRRVMKSGSFAEALGNSVSELNDTRRSGAGSPVLMCEGKHWSWITDNVVVGAVPYAGKASDTAAHLLGFQEQLTARGSSLAMVVSCLEIDELATSAGNREFAQPKDWEKVCRVSTFLQLSLPEDHNAEIDIPYADVAQACSQMYSAIQYNRPSDDKRQNKSTTSSGATTGQSSVVYIHCKGGRCRSWVPIMCYLTSQSFLSFEEAEAVVNTQRPGMTPSQAHRAYVRGFTQFIAEPIARARNEEEARYSSILAQILSMPQSYRLRLLNDLEKLT